MIAVSILRRPFLVASLIWAVAACGSSALSADDLPLRRVVLFTAGVGFFERGGEVQDTSLVELTFDTREINDLLKSLIVQDHGGGIVPRITYGSPDPLSRTLNTFAVDLSENPTLADLLDQMRGTRVRVTSAEPIEGMVVGLEVRVDRRNDVERETQWLNLLTEDGLRSLEMSTILAVKVLDARLDQQLQQALAEIAKSRQEEKRPVSIEFRGEGRRAVTIGYIREFPVWKTSYRLVVTEEKPPFLQGWAIVENTTDEDWSDVQLTLVSGRPVSFVMELDQPLYVARPHVMPELYGSVAPRVYDRGRAASARAVDSEGFPAGAAGALGGLGGTFGGGGLGMGGGFGGMGGMGAATDDNAIAEGESIDLERGVLPDVSAEEVGELFRYEIQLPVALPRNRSAMFPIVNEQVAGEKTSIYNVRTHAKHPMRGMKLTNDTDLHLMQGPITIFDGGAYAGDGRIRDLAPGASRLISYALDLDLQVSVQASDTAPVLAGVAIAQGTVVSRHSVMRTTTYTVDSEASSAGGLIVEHPINKSYQLSSREALQETAEDVYRFKMTARPGESAALVVQESQTSEGRTPLATIDESHAQQYLASDKVSEKVKDVFRQLLSKRRELTEIAAAILRNRDIVCDITSMQSRVRENMRALDRTSDLYQQYVHTLTEQERQLAELTRTLQEFEATRQQQEAALEQFMRDAGA
ncbi:MAG: hypothetical protein ACYC6N_28780 [Pirellulaceae bacterium]